VNAQRKLQGIIFSDLGAAAGFMALDWVQRSLRQHLGFEPFPATLNLRPKAPEDALAWERMQSELKGIKIFPPNSEFCAAQIFFVEIRRDAVNETGTLKGAVLLPEVANYPKDKIEVIAAVRLKDRLGVRDGDQLTLEFLN
jgi:CTP-dependent riboflavin kinase